MWFVYALTIEPDRPAFFNPIYRKNCTLTRVSRLDDKIAEIAENPLIQEGVKKLCCFSGISTLTAVSVISEIGDFSRFEKARYFSSYLGLCPGIHSSGLTNQSRGITKAGNKNLRRLLIEAAQSLSHSQICGKKSQRILARQKGMNPLIIAYVSPPVLNCRK